MTHHLKTMPEYFQAVIDGRKPFELRENDRDFKVGEKVILEEYLGRKAVPECPDRYCCKDEIDEEGQQYCELLNSGKRDMCVGYTFDNYSGRRCLVRIKEIFNLDKIGFKNYVAFTFDIMNITDKKGGAK